MRVFLAISCLVALVAARPDVSHLGYNYHNGYNAETIVNPTVTSHTHGLDIEATVAPTLSTLGLGLTSTVAPALGLDASSLLHSTSLPLGFSSSFGDLSAAAIPSTYGTLLGSTALPSTLAPFGLGHGLGHGLGLGLDATAIPSTIGAPLGFSASSFGYSGYDNLGLVQHQQAPIVSKHFYLHSAPEEARDEYHKHLVLGTPQKTYRVVFIKAPTSQTATRISASFAPTEEKTVIYVLSKKPEDLQINDIAAPPPTEPSKPEVFFIKYKTPEEAAHAQQQIQAQYDSLGGYSQLNDEGVAPVTSVIGSLGQTVTAAELAAAQFGSSQLGGIQHFNSPLHHISSPLSAGAIHHIGSPLSTISPTLDALSIGGLTSTIAPAYSTFGSTFSTVAPAFSTLGPAFSTLGPAVSTIAPAYSTVSSIPFSTVDSLSGPFASLTGDKYLPPRKH